MPVQDVSGTWTGTLSWKSTSKLLPSGSTSLTFTLSQAAGSNVVVFTSQPAETNGVKWACPQATMSNQGLTLSGACTLTNGSCQAQATPAITVTAATTTTAAVMSWQSYSYTWGGASCVANGVVVTVDAFDLSKPS